MIPETVFHRFIQLPLNVRLLIRATLDAADKIVRIRECPEDLIFIFLSKPAISGTDGCRRPMLYVSSRNGSSDNAT